MVKKIDDGGDDDELLVNEMIRLMTRRGENKK